LDKDVLAHFILAIHAYLLHDCFATTSDDLARQLRLVDAKAAALQQEVGSDSDVETLRAQARSLLRSEVGLVADYLRRVQQYPNN
jgi:hypothetical protein